MIYARAPPRVLFVMQLWGLRWPLCDDEQSAPKKQKKLAQKTLRATRLTCEGFCCYCARADNDTRVPPTHDFAARSSLVSLVARPSRPLHLDQPLLMERADRARDLSDKRDTRVSSEIIRSSIFGMRYLSDKRDTRVSYITR